MLVLVPPHSIAHAQAADLNAMTTCHASLLHALAWKHAILFSSHISGKCGWNLLKFGLLASPHPACH